MVYNYIAATLYSSNYVIWYNMTYACIAMCNALMHAAIQPSRSAKFTQKCGDKIV